MRVLKHGPFQPGQQFQVPGTICHFAERYGQLFVWSTDTAEWNNCAIIGTGHEYNFICHLRSVVDSTMFVWHLVAV